MFYIKGDNLTRIGSDVKLEFVSFGCLDKIYLLDTVKTFLPFWHFLCNKGMVQETGDFLYTVE